MEKSKKIPKTFLRILIIIIVVLIARIIINAKYNERFAMANTEKEYTVYYLLNIDGMKGLGHSALMLVDMQGSGLFYSYNGMQYSLTECLLGNAGIGKMKLFELNPEEVDNFLATGNLAVSDVSECDNFDRLLYKYISDEEYDIIKSELDYYITVSNTFEQLYSNLYISETDEKQKAATTLQEFLKREDIPKYQIYNHNCDTVAREAIATVDDEMLKYNDEKEKLTPSANYKNMWKQLDVSWGFTHIGQDSISEKLLWYIF